jgi:hypothetical protein
MEQGGRARAAPHQVRPNGSHADAVQVWPAPTVYQAGDSEVQQAAAQQLPPGQGPELAIAGRVRKQLAWERPDHTLPNRAQTPAAQISNVRELMKLYSQAGAELGSGLPVQAALPQQQQQHLRMGSSEGRIGARTQHACSSAGSGQTAVSWRELQAMPASAAQGRPLSYAPEQFVRDSQSADRSFQQPSTGHVMQHGGGPAYNAQRDSEAMLMHSSAMMMAASSALVSAPVQMHNGHVFDGAAAPGVDKMQLISNYIHMWRTLQVRPTSSNLCDTE